MTSLEKLPLPQGRRWLWLVPPSSSRARVLGLSPPAIHLSYCLLLFFFFFFLSGLPALLPPLFLLLFPSHLCEVQGL